MLNRLHPHPNFLHDFIFHDSDVHPHSYSLALFLILDSLFLIFSLRHLYVRAPLYIRPTQLPHPSAFEAETPLSPVRCISSCQYFQISSSQKSSKHLHVGHSIDFSFLFRCHSQSPSFPLLQTLLLPSSDTCHSRYDPCSISSSSLLPLFSSLYLSFSAL